jgi:membrane-bound ClpP family serine protease
MSVRLIWAIVSDILEETALALAVLLGLPRLGVHIPLAGLVAMMVAWLAVSVVIYRAGSRALRRKAVAGLSTMVGTRGKVVKRLAPRGVVRIKGELWEATSSSGDIAVGEEIIVTGQEGLRLVVSSDSASQGTG